MKNKLIILLIVLVLIPTVLAEVNCLDGADDDSDGNNDIDDTDCLFFAVIGDYGETDSKYKTQEVADLVDSWDVDFIITVGDNSYEGGTSSCPGGEQYSDAVGNFYNKYMVSGNEKFWPSLGNHDYCTSDASNYLSYFDYLPNSPGNKRYYKKSFGSVDIFSLDYKKDLPNQKTWLQQELKSSTATHKIVYFHTSPYTLGSHSAQTNMQWDFASMGATAVLTGHDHNYQRYSIDGIPYIVNGLGGRGRYTDWKRTESGGNTPLFKYASKNGAMKVAVSSTGITYQFINIDGEVIDTYSSDGSSQGNQRSTDDRRTVSSCPSYPTKLDCKNDQNCKEIDEAFSQIASLVGGSGDVWMPDIYGGGQWVDYDDLYCEEVVTVGSAVSSGSSNNEGSTYTGSFSCKADLQGSDNEDEYLKEAFLDAVSKAEGADYNTIVGGGTFSNYGDHPRQSVYINRLNVSSTAAGRYQFLESTYDSLKNKGYFLNGFGEREQDNAGWYLAGTKRSLTVSMLRDAYNYNDFSDVSDKVSLEWAGFPTKTNSAGAYDQGARSNEVLLSVFKQCYGERANPGKKVVVIGASNTVNPSYVTKLELLVTGYTFLNKGVSGESPSSMLSRFQSDVLDLNPDIVIIEPSVNGITSTTSYTNAVISMAQQAKSVGATVVVLSNSPHKWFNYCSGATGTDLEIRWGSADCPSKWSQGGWQVAIEEFNNNLLNNKLGISSDIDYVVDIYSILGDSPDSDVCNNCRIDGGHFNSVADRLIAEEIEKTQVFS